MNRRRFIQSAAAVATASLVHPRLSSAAPGRFSPGDDAKWRAFELTLRAELPAVQSATRVWLPLPSLADTDWSRNLGAHWEGNAASAEIRNDLEQDVRVLVAAWDAGEPAPEVQLKTRIATRDRAIPLNQTRRVAPLSRAAAEHYTRSTRLLPTDGIVKRTAMEITRNAGSDLQKARAIYEWVVEHTERNPKTRGCGVGDVETMLKTGNLSGKCADINALYVALARAAGLPARDLYGIRIADSRFGYKSLGKSGDITKAQHCRSEVWLAGLGWVPVDPADVRKVILEEQPGLSLKDEMVAAVRDKLFGAWEGNWLAFNCGHDVQLPGMAGNALPFFMYPQGQNGFGRFDCLDPGSFRYTITARELAPGEAARRV